MGLFGALEGLLQQATSGQGDVSQHYDQVANAAPASSIAGGLAEAFRSNETAPFAQMASQLFASGAGGDHQASLLNTLIASAGPNVLSSFLGQNSGSSLAGLLGGLGSGGQVTPEQAAAIPPEEVQALAAHVEKHDPSVIDRVSEVYAAHPTAVKALGALAMTLAVRKIAGGMHLAT